MFFPTVSLTTEKTFVVFQGSFLICCVKDSNDDKTYCIINMKHESKTYSYMLRMRRSEEASAVNYVAISRSYNERGRYPSRAQLIVAKHTQFLSAVRTDHNTLDSNWSIKIENVYSRIIQWQSCTNIHPLCTDNSGVLQFSHDKQWQSGTYIYYQHFILHIDVKRVSFVPNCHPNVRVSPEPFGLLCKHWTGDMCWFNWGISERIRYQEGVETVSNGQ